MKTQVPPQDPGSDRRRSPRMPYQTSLAYAVEDKSGVGRVRDMSSLGLFLEASEAFSVGDLLSMHFRFRHGHANMAISGEIRHIGPTGVGVKLIW